MTLSTRAPAISLINLTTLDTFEVNGGGILAPETSNERTTVNFADIAPFGLSHTRQQYGGTSNRALTIAFRVVVLTTTDRDRSREFLRFCQSFAYAPGNPTEPREAGPPLLVLVWPNVLSGTFRMRDIAIQRTLFNKLGEMTDGTVTLTLAEHLEQRLTHEDVREQGSFRIKLV